MTHDDEQVTFESVRCIASTDKACLCTGPWEDREIWFPISQIHDDSEVYRKGHEGKLIVTKWIADQKDLSGEPTESKAQPKTKSSNKKKTTDEKTGTCETCGAPCKPRFRTCWKCSQEEVE